MGNKLLSFEGLEPSEDLPSFFPFFEGLEPRINLNPSL